MTPCSSVSPSHSPLPSYNFIIETTGDELCFAVVLHSYHFACNATLGLCDDYNNDYKKYCSYAV